MLPTLSDLFSRALRPYSTHPKFLVGFITLFFLPIFFLGMLKFSTDLIGLVYDSMAINGLFLLVGSIFFSLISVWFTVAYTQAFADLDTGKNPEKIKTYLKKTYRLTLPAFGLSILVGLIVFGGFILLIIPGIIFSIWFALTIQARVLGNKKGLQALTYSRTLVQGNWWAVFVRITAGIFCILAIMSIYQTLVNIFAPFDLNTLTFQKLSVKFFILTVLTSILQAILTPFASAIPTILYLDLTKQTLPSTKEPVSEKV